MIKVTCFWITEFGLVKHRNLCRLVSWQRGFIGIIMMFCNTCNTFVIVTMIHASHLTMAHGSTCWNSCDMCLS